jgi:ATP-dependent helicase HrpB
LCPGRVIRLYPQEDLLRRPGHDTPEILRRELSGLLLQLRSMGLVPDDLRWFGAPPADAWCTAAALLQRLGAEGTKAREMARLPLHPRLAALVLEAPGNDGCRAAAVLSAGERLPAGAARQHGPSDVIALMEGQWSPATHRASSRSVESYCWPVADPPYCRNRVVVRQEWMVCADIEERRERGLPLVRLASAIRPEWLLDLYPERITERNGVEWNRSAERVEAVSALEYEGLPIEESRSGNVDAELAARQAAVAGFAVAGLLRHARHTTHRGR